jgi:molybdate transport repressor ModE-like protein
MNLDQLQTFVVLARCGSFTHAAQELNLSQPAVSRHVQKLEHELGTALLSRRRGDIELSEAGERLRAYAEEVVEGYERLLAVLGKGARPLEGELRISASTIPGEFLVPGLVAAFTARNPSVTPRILICDSAEVAAHLRSRRSDVGFSGVEVPDRDLHHQEFAADEIVLAVPADHPFASRGSVALTELAGQRFIVRESGSGTHRSFLAALREHGLETPAYRTAMVLGTTQAIVSAVQEGYGIGLVSRLALDARRAGPVAVRVTGLSLRRPLFLVVEKDRTLASVPSAFATWVLLQRR